VFVAEKIAAEQLVGAGRRESACRLKLHVPTDSHPPPDDQHIVT